MYLIDSMEKYAYGTRIDLLSGKEEIKCANIIKPMKENHLISEQPDTDKSHLHAEVSQEANQFLINKQERAGLKYFNDYIFLLNTQTIWMIFIKISSSFTILIAFDDMIADMLIKQKPNPIVTELFIRDRKLNTFLVFIWQSYFPVIKIVG